MIKVLLFGAAADRAGTRETELPVDEGVTLAEIWSLLAGRHPDLAQMPDCGAIATFVGTTRIDESDGAAVEYLEYEAYRPMADRKLQEIGAEIEGRWDVRHV